MKKMWIHAILPVLVVSTMVACGGKGGDDDAPVNRSRSTTPAEQQPQVNDETNGGLNLPDSNNQDQQNQNNQKKEDKNLLTPGDDQNDDSDFDENDDYDETDEGNVGGGPLDPGNETQIPSGPINSVYTGAGKDDLRQYLTESMNKVRDEDKRQKNLSLARSIESVRARVDVVASQAVVTIGSKRSSTPIILSGQMGQNGNARLSSRSSGMTGTMTCLDLNNSTCYVSLIRVRSQGAVAAIIVRHTAADANVNIPQDRKGTNDFLRLVDLFSNTKERNGEPNSLREILVQSFEVINGVSGIKVSIISKENQLITASGPLVGASDGSKLTNVIMQRDLNLEDLIEVERHSAFKTDLNHAIQEIRMVENDGVGNVSLLMTVNAADKKPGRLLKVGIKRKHVSIVPSAQVERLVKN